MFPEDVPPSLERVIDHGSWRGPHSGHDVICFVKRYISDKVLSQDPLLVLPHNDGAMLSLVPPSKSLGSQ